MAKVFKLGNRLPLHSALGGMKLLSPLNVWGMDKKNSDINTVSPPNVYKNTI